MRSDGVDGAAGHGRPGRHGTRHPALRNRLQLRRREVVHVARIPARERHWHTTRLDQSRSTVRTRLHRGRSARLHQPRRARRRGHDRRDGRCPLPVGAFTRLHEEGWRRLHEPRHDVRIRPRSAGEFPPGRTALHHRLSGRGAGGVREPRHAGRERPWCAARSRARRAPLHAGLRRRSGCGLREPGHRLHCRRRGPEGHDAGADALRQGLPAG